MKININKIENTNQELRKIKLENLGGADKTTPSRYSFTINFEDNEKMADFIMFCASITKDFIRNEEFELGDNKIELKCTDKEVVDKLIKMNILIQKNYDR